MDDQIIIIGAGSAGLTAAYYLSKADIPVLVIEKDEDRYYVGEVPGLRGCYSQGKTIDDLLENIKEAILLCLRTKAGRPCLSS